jgi:hypothetical protein
MNSLFTVNTEATTHPKRNKNAYKVRKRRRPPGMANAGLITLRQRVRRDSAERLNNCIEEGIHTMRCTQRKTHTCRHTCVIHMRVQTPTHPLTQSFTHLLTHNHLTHLLTLTLSHMCVQTNTHLTQQKKKNTVGKEEEPQRHNQSATQEKSNQPRRRRAKKTRKLKNKTKHNITCTYPL